MNCTCSAYEQLPTPRSSGLTPHIASNVVLLPCRMSNVISGNTADEAPLKTKTTIKLMVPNRMFFRVKEGAVNKDAWTIGRSRAVARQTGPKKECPGLYGSMMSFYDSTALCEAHMSSDTEHNHSHLFSSMEDLLCARTKLGTTKDSLLQSSGGKRHTDDLCE